MKNFYVELENNTRKNKTKISGNVIFIDVYQKINGKSVKVITIHGYKDASGMLHVDLTKGINV